MIKISDLEKYVTYSDNSDWTTEVRSAFLRLARAAHNLAEEDLPVNWIAFYRALDQFDFSE